MEAKAIELDLWIGMARKIELLKDYCRLEEELLELSLEELQEDWEHQDLLEDLLDKMYQPEALLV